MRTSPENASQQRPAQHSAASIAALSRAAGPSQVVTKPVTPSSLRVLWPSALSLGTGSMQSHPSLCTPVLSSRQLPSQSYYLTAVPPPFPEVVTSVIELLCTLTGLFGHHTAHSLLPVPAAHPPCHVPYKLVSFRSQCPRCTFCTHYLPFRVTFCTLAACVLLPSPVCIPVALHICCSWAHHHLL